MRVNRTIRVYRLEKELAEKDSRITQLQALTAHLTNENEVLAATPARIIEWQRQEVVATTGAVLDILGELSTKMGVVYGNVAAIQGVFVNKGALNMSAQTRREMALGKPGEDDGNKAA